VKQINVRLIAATNRDLRAEVLAGRFREDLFYRLSSIQIRIPSLRERLEDIPLLVQFFLKKYSERTARRSQD
jgi:DNA-binding NtrC family response regulator